MCQWQLKHLMFGDLNYLRDGRYVKGNVIDECLPCPELGVVLCLYDFPQTET